MALTIRSEVERIFGFDNKYSVPLTVGQEYTLQASRINSTVLANLRTFADAGAITIVDSDVAHGMFMSRPVTSRNQMLVVLGVDHGSGVVLPNASTLHYLTIGGVEFILGNSNIDGATATLQTAALVAALTASTDFAATGATIGTSTTLAAVAAVQTLTSTNTNVSNDDTVTIGNKTYTFKTSLTPTEGEVLIGATSDASSLNLIRAINHTGTPDTHYKCAAAHTQVSAAEAVTNNAFTITALTAGAAANAYATTEVAATLSWGAATMAGGVDDRGLLVIDGDAVADWAAFQTATELTDDAGDPLSTEDLAYQFLDASTTDALSTSVPVYVNRTVVAADVTRGYVVLDTGLTDLSTEFALRILRSSTPVAYNGTVTVLGSRYVVIQNDGSVDWAAADVIRLFARGND